MQPLFTYSGGTTKVLPNELWEYLEIEDPVEGFPADSRKISVKRSVQHWCCGVKGYIVCGKDYRDRKRHNRVDIKTAVEKLK